MTSVPQPVRPYFLTGQHKCWVLTCILSNNFRKVLVLRTPWFIFHYSHTGPQTSHSLFCNFPVLKFSERSTKRPSILHFRNVSSQDLWSGGLKASRMWIDWFDKKNIYFIQQASRAVRKHMNHFFAEITFGARENAS